MAFARRGPAPASLVSVIFSIRRALRPTPNPADVGNRRRLEYPESAPSTPLYYARAEQIAADRAAGAGENSAPSRKSGLLNGFLTDVGETTDAPCVRSVRRLVRGR